jgi:hypothetical protein
VIEYSSQTLLSIADGSAIDGQLCRSSARATAASRDDRTTRRALVREREANSSWIDELASRKPLSERLRRLMDERLQQFVGEQAPGSPESDGNRFSQMQLTEREILRLANEAASHCS